jgi:hypothetical protein
VDVRIFTWPAVEQWPLAAEDGVPRLLVLDPSGDFDELVTHADELLDEELCTPVLPVHDDDGLVVGLLDLLRGELVTLDGTEPAPADLLADAGAALEELTEMLLVCTGDELLVERVRLGLGLSPAALSAALRECWSQGRLPIALPVTPGGLGQGLLDGWLTG